MADKTVIKQRLEKYKSHYEKLHTAYDAILIGGVKSYTLESRQLTRLDLDKLADEMKRVEKEIDKLEATLSGKSARKAFGVIPRDW